MLMQWIDKMSRKTTRLLGQEGKPNGEFIGVVASFVIFGVLALLFVAAISAVTGISTSAIWSCIFVTSIVYTIWQQMR